MSNQPIDILRAAISRAASQRDLPALTVRQIALLLHVEIEPHTPSMIVSALGFPQPSITQSVLGLEALQLVRRKLDLQDNRRVWISITDRGRWYLARVLGMAGEGAE